MMEEDNNVKKAMLSLGTSIVVILLAYACLIVGAILQERGYNNADILPAVLTGFFGGNVLAIALFFKAYPILVRSDCARMDARYAGKELTEMSFPNWQALVRTFLLDKFQFIEEGYYRRKRFSLLRDFVCYYARITEDTDIENAFRREGIRLYQTQRREKNLCLLLFVYLDEVGEEDKKALKELNKSSIIMESVLNPNTSVSALVVAIDRRSNTGYYMEIGRHGRFTLYGYGCRMIRKLFGQGQ